MTKRTLFFGCFSIVLILACVPSTSAQVATGFPPFSSVATAPSGPDALNPANLNMHWTIPIFSKPGRGIPFVYNLTYDSSIWYPSGSTPYVYWTPTTNWGWSILNANQTGSLNVTPSGSTDCYVAGDYRGTTYFYNVYYQDPLGTSHYMGYAFYIDGGGDCEGQGPGSYPLSGSASDGSGFQIVSFLVFSPSTGMLNNMGTIITPSGATMVVPVMANNPVPATSITDSNGNEITTTAGTYIFNANYTQVTATGGVYTDSLGATVLTIAGSGTPASPITFTYPTPSGSNATVTMRYSSYNVRTHFGCSGVGEYSVSSGQNLVSEIDLPDNTKYTFTYEPTPGYSGYVTGRVASVAMPTGGTISYSYTGSNNGVVCHDGSAAGLTRTTPDGSWYYSRTTASPYLTTTTSVTPPGSIGHSVLTFSSQLLTGEQDYNASGTLLRTTLTCFNGTLPTGNPPSCASGIDSPLRHAEYVYWPNGQVGRRDTFYSSNTLPILPTEVDEYDYGSGAPGPLLRKTLTTYATNLGNIINKPASVTIEDGSNAIKAQTTYTYDQGSVTGTTGVPQHVSVSGSRGNLTTVTKLVQGSTTVSATNTYYDTGNVQYAYDFKSNPTTYGYSSAYGYAYPTTVTNALNQTTTYTYNAYTGLVASVTDPNNQTTSSSYDFMLRPTQVSYPDGGLTTKCYTDVGGSTCSASSAPFKTVTTQKMNSTQNLITTAVTDGLGRVVEQQVNSDPDGWVYTDNSFDALGRPYCASNPYRSTSDPTYGLTCNTYDALGRLTTVTNPDGTAISTSYTGRATSVQDEGNGTQHVQRVSQVDGLGRLASLCEVTSAALTVGISGSTTPAACGQDIAATGFLTTYAYDTLDNLMSVAQGPLNARTFSYDSLSRLTSATNPESGTTSYTYDADSNVITKTDARGVTTCFGTWTGSSCNASSGYDALNH